MRETQIRFRPSDMRIQPPFDAHHHYGTPFPWWWYLPWKLKMTKGTRIRAKYTWEFIVILVGKKIKLKNIYYYYNQ